MISPTYEIVLLVQHQILLFASLSLRMSTLTIMPEFTPTPFMLEKYANKDKGGPWTIYAWCLRDAICKQSGLIPLDEKLSFKDKSAFIGIMNAQVDRAEING